MSGKMYQFLVDLYNNKLIDHLLDYIKQFFNNSTTESLAFKTVVPYFIKNIINEDVKSMVQQLVYKKDSIINSLREQNMYKGGRKKRKSVKKRSIKRRRTKKTRKQTKKTRRQTKKTRRQTKKTRKRTKKTYKRTKKTYKRTYT
jgi:hypothetical protein